MFASATLRVARIFGIEIEVSYSWFIIFVLVALQLTFYFSSRNIFALPGAIVAALLTSVLFFGSVILHEVSHSLVAQSEDIPVKKITLFIFGGMAQTMKEAASPLAEFKVAIAGPLTSIALGVIFKLIEILGNTIGSTGLAAPFFWLSLINFILAGFNLMPGFPLDGGRVLRAAIWYRTKDVEKATRLASWGGQALAISLIFLGFMGVLRGNLGAVWFVLIGWFLREAADSSYRQLLLQRSLADVKVEEIMTTEVAKVPPSLKLDELVKDYFMRHRYARFPVAEQDSLIGVVNLEDVKEVGSEEWPAVTVEEVMKPVSSIYVTKPDEEAIQALMQMAQEGVGHLMVVENGHLLGLITQADISRLVKIRTELET